jgi:hypothetical protein
MPAAVARQGYPVPNAESTAVGASSQCQTGGSNIEFGLDQNRNGTLDDPEVSSMLGLADRARAGTR